MGCCACAKGTDVSAVWQIVSLLFVAIFVLSVVIQLRTWRRQRRVRPIFIVISQVAALAASIGFSVLTDRPPEADVWVGLLAVGIAGGVIYGGMMNIDRNERGVVMSYSFPAIITWTALMTITQLSAILSKSVPVVIFSIAIANLGVNLGMNGRVLYGYSRVRVGPAVGLLAVVALAVVPVLPAGAQEDPTDGQAPLDFTGVYLIDLGTAEVPGGEVLDQELPLEVLPGGEVRASLAVSFRYVEPALRINDQVISVELDNTISMECTGRVSSSGALECSGTMSVTSSGVVPLSGEPILQSSSGSTSLTGTIFPDGTFAGVMTDPNGYPQDVSGYAISGGPTPLSVPDDSSPVAPISFSGVYQGSYELGPDVPPIPVTVVVGDDMAASCSTDVAFDSRDGLQTNIFQWSGSGSVSETGSIFCSGPAVFEAVAHDAGTCVDLSEPPPGAPEGAYDFRECIVSPGAESITQTMDGQILPDGTVTGVMCAESDCIGFGAVATSGGPTAGPVEGPDTAGEPPASSRDDGTATPGIVPTPLPGDIGDAGTGEFPFAGTENPPLEPEDAAAATALSAFLLAGGSMAQLLPLMEGGVSMADALRALQGSTAPSGASSGSLGGLPTLEDGRVMYQPPWEEGGPVPMDPDWVLEVMDMERRGFRWMGESKGWMNDAQVAQNERWEAADRAAVAQAKEEFIAGHRAREAELERRREALRFVGHAAEAALKRDDDVMQMAYDQIQAQAYNEDGSLNLEYVGELRSFMRNRLLRDIDYPEESLHQGWVGDFASNTFDEARHSAAIRILAGIGTGGQSEWLYQAQAVVDAVGEAAKNSEQPLTIADGLRAGYWAAADENLPVTTLAKVYNGEEVTVFDVLGDVMKGRATQQYVKHEYFGDAHGLLRSQRRALQATATRHNVDYTPMNVTSRPGFRTPGELAEGKPMFMKQKSINSDDVRYLDYSPSDIGRVPGQPRPPKPSKFTDAAEYRAAKAHYRQRVAEWQSAGGATRTKMASGEVVEVDGLLYTVKDGKPHAPYVSDIEPADVFDHSTGRRLTDDRIVRVQDDMAQRGLPVGDHGSPYSFDPRVTLKDDFPADVLERIERVEIPGTGGAKPTVSWRLDGEELTGEVAERLKKADDLRTRLIDKVEAGDVGEEFIAGGSAGTRRWADYGEGFEHIQGASGTAVQDLGERGYW
jgi:hypothetical protein